MGVVDEEEEEGAAMCTCTLTHKDENPPKQWPLDYIRPASHLVLYLQELYLTCVTTRGRYILRDCHKWHRGSSVY